MNTIEPASSRRRFFGRLAGTVAAASVPLLAGATTADASSDATDSWLRDLKGKHRQLFHTFESRDGRALEQAKAFLDIYPTAYGIKTSAANAVVAAHGYMLGMLLSDDAWKKYGLGDVGHFTDPRTKAPATRNIYLTEGAGETLEAGTSVPALMKRGVTFLACNNALTGLSFLIAQESKLEQSAVYADLRSALVPGTVVVPAMIIAINRAQEHGLTYIYCG